jgi:hypothetical protein
MVFSPPNHKSLNNPPIIFDSRSTPPPPLVSPNNLRSEGAHQGLIPRAPRHIRWARRRSARPRPRAPPADQHRGRQHERTEGLGRRVRVRVRAQVLS